VPRILIKPLYKYSFRNEQLLPELKIENAAASLLGTDDHEFKLICPRPQQKSFRILSLLPFKIGFVKIQRLDLLKTAKQLGMSGPKRKFSRALFKFQLIFGFEIKNPKAVKPSPF
jgi:hypothetical protein